MDPTTDDLQAWWAEIDPLDDLDLPDDVWDAALDAAFDDTAPDPDPALYEGTDDTGEDLGDTGDPDSAEWDDAADAADDDTARPDDGTASDDGDGDGDTAVPDDATADDLTDDAGIDGTATDHLTTGDEAPDEWDGGDDGLAF